MHFGWLTTVNVTKWRAGVDLAERKYSCEIGFPRRPRPKARSTISAASPSDSHLYPVEAEQGPPNSHRSGCRPR